MSNASPTSGGGINASLPVRKYSHYEVAYIKLRTGMAVLAFLVPITFLLVSWALRGTEIRPSISAYYDAGDLERNLLVGMLVTVGILLFLYEGYSNIENRVLDFAGILLLGVAFFPYNMESFQIGNVVVPVAWLSNKLTVHGICAVIFFILIIIVATVLSGNTLKGRPAEFQRKWKRRYNLVSTWMVISMAGAVAGHLLSGDGFMAFLFHKKAVFWVETAGIVGFGVFWLMKTKEVNPTMEYRPFPLDLASVETEDDAQKLKLKLM